MSPPRHDTALPQHEAVPLPARLRMRGGDWLTGARERMLRWRRRPRRVQVPPLGKAILLTMMLTLFFSGVLGLQAPLYHFSLLVVAVVLVCRGAQFLYRPRLRIRRHLPERCAVGSCIQVRAGIRNASFFPLFDFVVTETIRTQPFRIDPDPPLIDCLPARGSMDWTYPLTPTRRGIHQLEGPQAYTLFPFSLCRHHQYLRQPRRMIVYPAFLPLHRIAIPTGRRHQPGGLQLASHVGDSPEFLGNREYRPGDRLRDLHHIAWARLGSPVVREYQEEYLTRIGLVVDTYVPPSCPEGKADLEAALSLAASIADCLSRQEYVIDIFAAGPDLYQFQAGRSLAYLENILDILACIEACPHNPFVTLEPAIRDELQQISTLILLVLDWDETRQRFLRTLRHHGVAVKCILVREDEPAHDIAGVLLEGRPIQHLTRTLIAGGIQSL